MAYRIEADTPKSVVEICIYEYEEEKGDHTLTVENVYRHGFVVVAKKPVVSKGKPLELDWELVLDHMLHDCVANDYATSDGTPEEFVDGLEDSDPEEIGWTGIASKVVFTGEFIVSVEKRTKKPAKKK